MYSSRRNFLTSLAALALSSTALGKSAPYVATKDTGPIRIGFLTLDDGASYAERMFSAAPLIEHIQERGFKASTFLIESRKENWARILVREQYDMVCTPPEYAVTAKLLGYTPIACAMEATSPLLVCGAASSIRSINDVAGSRVLIREGSIDGTIVKYELMRLNVISKMKLLDAGRVEQEWLSKSIAVGLADIASVDRNNLTKDLRVLHECTSIPGAVWLTPPRVPAERSAKLASAILSYQAGTTNVASQRKISGGLKAVSAGDIDQIRAVLFSGVERYRSESVSAFKNI